MTIKVLNLWFPISIFSYSITFTSSNLPEKQGGKWERCIVMERKLEVTIKKNNLANLSSELWTIFYKVLLYFSTIFVGKSIHSFKVSIYWVLIFCQACCVLVGILFTYSAFKKLIASDLFISGHDTFAGFTISLPPRQIERLYRSKRKNIYESIKEQPEQWKFENPRLQKKGSLR